VYVNLNPLSKHHIQDVIKFFVSMLNDHFILFIALGDHQFENQWLRKLSDNKGKWSAGLVGPLICNKQLSELPAGNLLAKCSKKLTYRFRFVFHILSEGGTSQWELCQVSCWVNHCV
jgi:hypothetical protein